MRKFFEENTLLAQAVVGEKESIADFIHKADKEEDHTHEKTGTHRRVPVFHNIRTVFLPSFGRIIRPVRNACKR